jgi:poly-gamma-glutamate capsule biosynthesis protein CapA/YwtB (metallophosphatase superfamily)
LLHSVRSPTAADRESITTEVKESVPASGRRGARRIAAGAWLSFRVSCRAEGVPGYGEPHAVPSGLGFAVGSPHRGVIARAAAAGPGRMVRGFCSVAGPAALLVLTVCSSADRPAERPALAVAASQVSAASPAGVQAVITGAAGPGTSTAATSVTITAVGDTMLGNTPDLPPDPATYFEAVQSTLKAGAQVVFGNLEGTLTTSTASKCGAGGRPDCFAFRDPPGYARYFKKAGFTILNDANNHSFDFGAAGQAQTVRAIHAAGMAQTGLPGEITNVKANAIKVAFVAFAPYSYDADLLDLPAARALIRRAAREAHVVVVYMHAGAEGPSADHVTGREEYYLGEDRGNPEAFAHMAINAGASLVIASGPHVLRGMQFYKHHLIAYSLGNFAGYGNFSTQGDLDISVILRVTLSPAGQFERARIYPIQFTAEGRPVPGGGATAFIARLALEDFGSSAARILASGVIKAP